mmetsp:Transcript_23859/g.27692  ORF Transcript_23859/g.27692 Transcript_23859/m.27692 type:complete len:214 (+) Transcript_23859:285-926(+)
MTCCERLRGFGVEWLKITQVTKRGSEERTFRPWSHWSTSRSKIFLRKMIHICCTTIDWSCISGPMRFSATPFYGGRCVGTHMMTARVQSAVSRGSRVAFRQTSAFSISLSERMFAQAPRVSNRILFRRLGTSSAMSFGRIPSPITICLSTTSSCSNTVPGMPMPHRVTSPKTTRPFAILWSQKKFPLRRSQMMTLLQRLRMLRMARRLCHLTI